MEPEELTSAAEAAACEVDDAVAVAELRPIRIGPTSSLETNLIGVPIYTLNSSATRATNSITYSWEAAGKRSVFTFERPDYVPFPQLQHAELFYTLLAMFAQRPNDDGDVYFRLVDIARNAGRSADKKHIYSTIKEMIWRYSHCQVHWNRAWEHRKSTEYANWHGPLIIFEDLFEDGDHRKLKRNPRNSRKEESWHCVKLHPMVVQSIKSQFVRIFLTETLQSGMSETAKCVYRYFFRFSDQSAVYRPFEHLMQAFPWRSGTRRFIAWLKTQLDELKGRGMIESFEIQDDGVLVKCIPIRTLKLTRVEDKPPLVRAGATRKASAPEATYLPELSDDELLRRVPALQAEGLISEGVIQTLASLLASDRTMAAKSLRRHLSRRG